MDSFSERYPMCSQLITQNRIPEFGKELGHPPFDLHAYWLTLFILDNLYLDMNGIVHNCSHNNNDNAHYRISEEEIWIGIFNYVDHVFAKIKPKKLFFLAIDGVAPRAKMNQQRSRRFRTAKDAEATRLKALERGEELPEEPPFDSNCITPGNVSDGEDRTGWDQGIHVLHRYRIYGQVDQAAAILYQQKSIWRF